MFSFRRFLDVLEQLAELLEAYQHQDERALIVPGSRLKQNHRIGSMAPDSLDEQGATLANVRQRNLHSYQNPTLEYQTFSVLAESV